MAKSDERVRMMFDLKREVQIAIKLRAAKDDMTTGDIVSKAIRLAFAHEIEEARASLGEKSRPRA